MQECHGGAKPRLPNCIRNSRKSTRTHGRQHAPLLGFALALFAFEEARSQEEVYELPAVEVPLVKQQPTKYPRATTVKKKSTSAPRPRPVAQPAAPAGQEPGA